MVLGIWFLGFRRRRWLSAAAFLLLVWLGWAAWQRLHHNVPRPIDDPRLTFASPYRNIRPDVKYVGSGICGTCHPGEAASYRHHPMGNSLAPVSKAGALERFERESHNPFEAFGFQFLIERRNGKLFHKEARHDSRGQTTTEFEAEINYVIGSGARARSYLIERDGYLFQSAITWYSQKELWDLSPGFAANPHSDRPITAECLFCHCNRAEAVENTVNRYRLPIFQGYSIGCERCHGPGELHVQRREQGELADGEDDTIVNPGSLAADLREAVCQQCHLQGEMRILHRGRKAFDYRPGLPWQLFWTVFVKPPDTGNNPQAVGQVEQMYASRCYQAGGKLGCVSCHDPHSLPEPATRVAYYRARCLSCHTEADCRRPRGANVKKNQDDDCIRCHMPRLLSSDVAHTAITDHRILRQPSQVHPLEAPASAPRVDDFPLLAFPFDPLGSNVNPQAAAKGSGPTLAGSRAQATDPEGSRDFGLALMKLAESRTFGRSARMRLTADALPLLDVAIKAFPEDSPAWQARGYALWQQNRKEEARVAFETALCRTPDGETALIYAASLAAEMGQYDSAIAYWQRALAVNPWAARSHFELARLLVLRQQWQQAGEEAKAVLELNPFHIEARKLLVVCYHQRGNKAQARAEFDRLLQLNPPDQETLHRWFDQLSR